MGVVPGVDLGVERAFLSLISNSDGRYKGGHALGDAVVFDGDGDVARAVTERGEVVDLEATLEVKAVLGMCSSSSVEDSASRKSSSSEPASSPKLAQSTTPTTREEPQWGHVSLMSTAPAGVGLQAQTQGLVFQPQQWVFLPAAELQECCRVQGSLWQSTSGMWRAAPTAALAPAPCQAAGTPPALRRGEGPGAQAPEQRTTVMLRNLPKALTREMLIRLLDCAGFRMQYDLVYIPVDFSTGNSLGYAFINMTTPATAAQLWNVFDGFSGWRNIDSSQVCSVSWSEPHQGLAPHIERYRNSPVMHPDVPDEWKPALFLSGTRVAFPPPTKKLKAPKVRSKKMAETGF